MDNTFALFIDELRESRNISKPEFVKDVISIRQYQRYLNGESALKSDALIKLFDKLQLNTSSIVKLITNNAYTKYSELLDAYNALYKNEYKNANDLLKHIVYSDIQSSFQKKMYRLVDTISSYNLNLKDKNTAIEEMKEIIDYPNILKKTSLNLIETSGLHFISSKLTEQGDYRIANFTYDRLMRKSGDTTKSINDIILYSSIAKSLGIINEFEKAYNISKLGIEEYVYTSGLNILEGLLYLQALSEKNLGKKNAYKKTLSRLFAQLYAEGNDERFQEYEKLVNRVFNLKVNDLITIW